MICKKTDMHIRVALFICFLLANAYAGFSQTPNPALLQARLQKSRPDTERLNILLQLSGYYNDMAKPLPHVNDALAHAIDAEKLSTLLMYKQGLANSYVAQAKAYRNKRDTAQAMEHLRLAKNVFVTETRYREAAEITLNMEEFYQYFGGTDLNVRIAYYEQALELFKRTPAKDRQEATLKVLGDLYYVLGDHIRSLQYLEQGLSLIKYVKIIDKESLYDLLGSVNMVLGDLKKALEYGLLAVKMAELGNDTTMQACAVYNRVGITYYNMKDFKLARSYFERSLSIAAKCGDIESQINEYVLIGQSMAAIGRFADCIALLKNAARKFPAIAIDRYPGFDVSMLKCYVHLKNFAEAKIYCDRLEARLKKDGQSNFALPIHNYLTGYYIATGEVRPARMHMMLLKKLAADQHNTSALSLAYKYQASLDSVEKNFSSAYKNARIASRMRDSIWNEKKTQQVAQLQIGFEAEKKDQQLKTKEERIKLLNNWSRLHQVDLDQERTTQKLITGGAILLLILLGLSYNGYRLKQRVNRQLEAQQAEIEEKNRSLNMLVHQKDHLLEEKEWLMKEIHHRVKNNLQIVISLLSTQSKYLDNDIAYNAIRESQHRMQSISLIHQKLYQSDDLAMVDIGSYIADLITYLRESFDTGQRIIFETDITHAEMDVTRAVPLGLILNEAITNAIKYAFPGNRNGTISISLKPQADGSSTLKIHDDGVGLPPAMDITKSRSLGMSLMRGLSKQLGGNLNIENSNGITITIDLIDEKLLKTV